MYCEAPCPKQLTEEQKTIDAALSGHNMCILGRAGVGKTTVVQAIKKVLASKDLNCQIVVQVEFPAMHMRVSLQLSNHIMDYKLQKCPLTYLFNEHLVEIIS